MATYMDKGNTKPVALQGPYKPGTATQTLFNTTVPKMAQAPKPSKVVYTNSKGTVSTPYQGGGGTYGGSGGSYGGSQAPAPAAPPMDVNAWLGQDSTYQSQAAAFIKALADYKAQQAHATSDYSTNYAARTNDLGINKVRSVDNQANDFAARGTYVSGVYGKEYSDLLGDFARRQSDMDTAKSQYLAGLQQDYTNFFGQQQIDQTKAKQDAINRRALQYGI
jgi:hypothetical protein